MQKFEYMVLRRFFNRAFRQKSVLSYSILFQYERHGKTTVKYIIIALLLVMSALFSSMETAFSSVNKIRLTHGAANKIISKILAAFPKTVQDFYSRHESALLYIIVGGMTTAVSVKSLLKR